MNKNLIFTVLVSISPFSLFGMSGYSSVEDPRYDEYFGVDRDFFNTQLRNKLNYLYFIRFVNIITKGTTDEVKEFVEDTPNLMEGLQLVWQRGKSTIFHVAAEQFTAFEHDKLLENVRTLITSIPMEERQKIEQLNEPITPQVIGRLIQEHMDIIEQTLAAKDYRGRMAYEIAVASRNSNLKGILDPNNPAAREVLRPIVAENIQNLVNEQK